MDLEAYARNNSAKFIVHFDTREGHKRLFIDGREYWQLPSTTADNIMWYAGPPPVSSGFALNSHYIGYSYDENAPNDFTTLLDLQSMQIYRYRFGKWIQVN